MWLWNRLSVPYPQVRECRLAPVHPWHAPTHESVPLWEIHRRCPRAKEGPTSLCRVYRTGTCLQGILGYDQELQRQKETLWWQESKSQGYCLQTWYQIIWKTDVFLWTKILITRQTRKHSTFIILQYGIPSCQAWQPYHEAQYVCSKLNLNLACTDANTEFILLTAAMKSPIFLYISASSCTRGTICL